MVKVFYVSGTAAVLGIIAAYYYAGWEGVFFTAILSVLEISLSIENAIVNAIVLKDMSEKWRERFLTWGIIIAVFGMRLLFPVILVSTMTHLNPLAVIDLAIEFPKEYAHYLHAAHDTIAAFGGMFLLMVFLEFILDHEREIHWLGVLERNISKIGSIEAIEVTVALIILLMIQSCVLPAKRAPILVAGISGLTVYVIVYGLAKFLNSRYGPNSGRHVEHAGLMSFLYLEFLDASFSFDGVIGAFAITKDIVIIVLGLGIGAFFVRSMTILLVQKRTLQKYIYLEHGAYYALGALSILMLLSIFMSIPEVLIGTLGAIVIALAFLSSLRHNHVNLRKP